MAQDFSKAFYDSKAWRDCRKAYRKSVGGLCEKCLAKGLYRAADVVHHRIVLTPENVKQPEVTLNWANLEALCFDCHAEEHQEEVRQGIEKAAARKPNVKRRRWRVTEGGKIAPLI